MLKIAQPSYLIAKSHYGLIIFQKKVRDLSLGVQLLPLLICWGRTQIYFYFFVVFFSFFSSKGATLIGLSSFFFWKHWALPKINAQRCFPPLPPVRLPQPLLCSLYAWKLNFGQIKWGKTVMLFGNTLGNTLGTWWESLENWMGNTFRTSKEPQIINMSTKQTKCTLSYGNSHMACIFASSAKSNLLVSKSFLQAEKMGGCRTAVVRSIPGE